MIHKLIYHNTLELFSIEERYKNVGYCATRITYAHGHNMVTNTKGSDFTESEFILQFCSKLFNNCTKKSGRSFERFHISANIDFISMMCISK